jgi:hypothetical protein
VRLPGRVLPLENAAEGDLFLKPIPCQHVQMSTELIEAVAAEVRPGRALILGAGRCREIPLVSLAQRFDMIALQDQDADALATSVALLDDAPQIKAIVTTEVRDLTGITDALIAGAEQRLSLATSAEHAHQLLIELVTDTHLAPPPPSPEWDLVISSCVGTQLHLRALEAISRKLDPLSPQDASAWADAMLRASWRLHDEYLEYLLTLVERDGRIYLSDTVQVGTLYPSLDGGWRTPGWYRLTRERFLAELLPPSAQPLYGGQWPYVAASPSLSAPGLLYNVHAVVMSRR